MSLTTLGEILLIASTFGALLQAVPDLFAHPTHDFLPFRLVIGIIVGIAVAGMCLCFVTSETGWFLGVGGLAALLGFLGDQYWQGQVAEHKSRTRRQRRRRSKQLGRAQDRAILLIALAAILGSVFALVGSS